MRINIMLQKYSLSFFIGFLLFFSSTIFSFTRNIRLRERIAVIENQEKSNRLKLSILETQSALQRKYLRKKLLEFKGIDYNSKVFSSETLRKHQFSLIILIVGECSFCFEQEAHIWDKLINEMKSKGLLGIGINVALDRNLILHYLKDGTINYPILPHQEIFSNFLGEFQDLEVVAFLVNSDLVIEKVHASQPKQHELTTAFAEEVRSFLSAFRP